MIELIGDAYDKLSDEAKNLDAIWEMTDPKLIKIDGHRIPKISFLEAWRLSGKAKEMAADVAEQLGRFGTVTGDEIYSALFYLRAARGIKGEMTIKSCSGSLGKRDDLYTKSCILKDVIREFMKSGGEIHDVCLWIQKGNIYFLAEGMYSECDYKIPIFYNFNLNK